MYRLPRRGRHGRIPDRMARHGISYGPQDQAIFQDLTFVRIFCSVWKTRATSIWSSPHLRDLRFHGNRLKQRAGTLSGGEQNADLGPYLDNKTKTYPASEITEGLQPPLSICWNVRYWRNAIAPEHLSCWSSNTSSSRLMSPIDGPF